ncbi:MAG: ABC transporter substrate-binding protein [Acidobacteriota bacterium]
MIIRRTVGRAAARLRSAAVLVAALGALWGAGCGAPGPGPSRPLRIALEAGPVGMDPHRFVDYHTLNVLAQVYEGLTSLDGRLRVRPALARSWETPGEDTWIFHLRPGVAFHDGHLLSAADVVFSLHRAQQLPGSDLAGYLLAVRDCRALDSDTVEIVTAQPTATLLAKLAFVAIVPAASPPQISMPVGTGPYRVVSVRPGDRVELLAWSRYWGGAASTKSVWLEAVEDDGDRVRRLVDGEADLVSGMSPADVARVNAARGCRGVSVEGLTVSHLEMRVDALPFSDPRVRQAVNLSIDRGALVENVYHGQARAASQMLTANAVGYAPDLQPAVRDLAQARRLLAQAGYPAGLDVELEFRVGADLPMAEIKRQLGEAGIRVRLRRQRWEDLYPRLTAGKVPFYAGAVIAESGDASDLLDAMAHTRGATGGYGEANSSGYSNPELDRRIELADRTLDPLARREILQGCLRTWTAGLADVPLLVPFDIYGVRADLDWRPRLDGLILADDVRRLDSDRGGGR